MYFGKITKRNNYLPIQKIKQRNVDPKLITSTRETFCYKSDCNT